LRVFLYFVKCEMNFVQLSRINSVDIYGTLCLRLEATYADYGMIEDVSSGDQTMLAHIYGILGRTIHTSCRIHRD